MEEARRALVGIRRRLRALAERERVGPLPQSASALRRRLRGEAHDLAVAIRRLLTVLPDDSESE